MPVIECDWSSLKETIEAAEKKGLEIVQVVDGPRLYVIANKPKRQYETRKRSS